MLHAIDMNNLTGIIVDVVAVFILLIFLLSGIKKGFLKSIRGLISAILVIVIAVFAVVPVTDLLTANVSWDEDLTKALETPVNSMLKLKEPYIVLTYLDGENIAYDKEGNEIKGLVYLNEDGDPVPFEKLANSSGAFQKFILNAFVKSQTEKTLKPANENDDAASVFLINAATNAFTVYIFLAGVFIALLIVLNILLAILFYFIKKLIGRLYVIHFLDKILGAALGLALGAVFVYAVITILLLLQNNAFMEPVNIAIKSSYFVKYIAQYDFLYQFLKDKLKIFETINEMIKNVAS